MAVTDGFASKTVIVYIHVPLFVHAQFGENVQAASRRSGDSVRAFESLLSRKRPKNRTDRSGRGGGYARAPVAEYRRPNALRGGEDVHLFAHVRGRAGGARAFMCKKDRRRQRVLPDNSRSSGTGGAPGEGVDELGRGRKGCPG